jgi:hypothetical protein
MRFDYSRAKAGDATDRPSSLSRAIREGLLREPYRVLLLDLVDDCEATKFADRVPQGVMAGLFSFYTFFYVF